MVKNRAAESRARANEVRERLAKSVNIIVDIIHGYIDDKVEQGRDEVRFEKSTLIADCKDKGEDVGIAARDICFYEQAKSILRKEGYDVVDALYNYDDIKISWKG